MWKVVIFRPPPGVFFSLIFIRSFDLRDAELYYSHFPEQVLIFLIISNIFYSLKNYENAMNDHINISKLNDL